MQRDHDSAPPGANHVVLRVLDLLEQTGELLGLADAFGKLAVPQPASFTAVVVEEFARIDRREWGELFRDGGKARIGRELRVIEIEARAHQWPPVVDTLTAPSALLRRG